MYIKDFELAKEYIDSLDELTKLRAKEVFLSMLSYIESYPEEAGYYFDSSFYSELAAYTAQRLGVDSNLLQELWERVSFPDIPQSLKDTNEFKEIETLQNKIDSINQRRDRLASVLGILYLKDEKFEGAVCNTLISWGLELNNYPNTSGFDIRVKHKNTLLNIEVKQKLAKIPSYFSDERNHPLICIVQDESNANRWKKKQLPFTIVSAKTLFELNKKIKSKVDAENIIESILTKKDII